MGSYGVPLSLLQCRLLHPPLLSITGHFARGSGHISGSSSSISTGLLLYYGFEINLSI